MAVSYPVAINFPDNVDIVLPIWGTMLPDNLHPSGRWSVVVVQSDHGPVLQFLADPEIVLYAGAVLDFFRGQNIIFTVTIL